MIFATAVLTLAAASVTPIYSAMEATNHDDPHAAFEFSAADATSDDPIRITSKGRKLEPKDREYRTDLQRYWLNQHVGAEQKLTLREQVLCMRKQSGTAARCDRYVFSDKSGSKHEYYFYLNNWP